MKFDYLDYQIIRELRANGRASASEIARKLDANQRTIRKRIDRLVETGAIFPTVVIDPEAFDYVTSADVFIEVEPQHEAAIMDTLCQMPEVSYVAYGLGSHDLSIEVRSKTNAELYDFVRNTLGNMQGVTVNRFVLVPRILKNAHEWMPKEQDFEPASNESP